VSGDGLQSGGQEQGMSVYGRENVPASNVMTVSVSGTAPALQNEASDSRGGGRRSGCAGCRAGGGQHTIDNPGGWMC